MVKPLVASAIVFCLSLVVLAGFTFAVGASKKFDHGDATQFLAIAQSLAAGKGYRNPAGPWPNHAAYDRMPGWPVIMALGLRVAPGIPSEAVTRLTNALCLALGGMFFCLLCQRLGVRPIFSIFAGFAVSLSPSLVYLSVEGMSEVAFVMTIAMGLTGLFSRGRWFYLGAMLIGTGALIRTNFILVPPCCLGLALLFPITRRWLLMPTNLKRSVLACTLALLPSLFWAGRNYSLTGRFPLLCSMEGETLYGGNNDVVANDLKEWGYWVMPNDIPGERPKLELAKALPNDLALNDYYHGKAIAWINAHHRDLPRLILGKFIRAFVPVPWVPIWPSFFVFFCRFLLYVVCLILLPYWRHGMDGKYLLFLSSMSAVQVLTTTVYYGVFRFTHCFIEILFVPCIFLGLQRFLDMRSGGRKSSIQITTF